MFIAFHLASDSVVYRCAVGVTVCMLPQILSSSSTGRENVTISIIWNPSTGPPHTIDLLTPVSCECGLVCMVFMKSVSQCTLLLAVILYNCTLLVTGCALCLGANLGTGFECGWCDGSSDDTCRVSEKCLGPAQFVTSSTDCSGAQIISVTPSSGPVEGGTTITITGTDLGVTYADIENNIMINSSPCITQEAGYIPGTQIVCETTALTRPPGTKDVIISVQRNGSSVLVVGSSRFTLVEPAVTGIEPALGPMSGGASITIRGTGLNVGNTEDTRVTLGGEDGPECRIQMQ